MFDAAVFRCLRSSAVTHVYQHVDNIKEDLLLRNVQILKDALAIYQDRTTAVIITRKLS